MRRSKPVLPGQSRSPMCLAGSKTPCHRLLGHKGSHRSTLTATKSPVVKAPVVTEGGVEVLSFDKYTVQPETKSRNSVAKPRRATKSLPICRAAKAGIRCDRPTGHAAYGLRHRFVGRVVVIADATAEGRDVQTVKGKSSRRRNFVASGKPSSRLA